MCIGIYTVGLADQAYPIRITNRATRWDGTNWLKLQLGGQMRGIDVGPDQELEPVKNVCAT
jgi:hypothetical protein